MAVLAAMTPLAYPSQVRDVLIVYSDERLRPANMEADPALQETILAHDPSVDIHTEFLDQARFSGPDYDAAVVRFLMEKYRYRAPTVIVAASDAALTLFVRHRSELFPGVPVVFLVVGRERMAELSPLPADVVGAVAEFDYWRTAVQALELHPNAKRIVAVSGASPTDRDQVERMQRELAGVRLPVPVTFLRGLDVEDLAERLAALGEDTVVFTLGFERDGAGRPFTPYESAQIIAGASSAPVFAPYSTFLGTGVVGGWVLSFSGMAKQAARMVNQILDGAPAEKIGTTESAPVELVLDWRALKRWGVPPERVPPEAVIKFRDPTFWDIYGRVILISAAIILVQGLLITALLYERRRERRMAEALRESELRMRLVERASRMSRWTWNVARAEPAAGGQNSSHDSALISSASEPSAISVDEALARAHPADRNVLEQAIGAAIASDEELDVEYRTIEGEDVRWVAVRGRPGQGQESGQMSGIAFDVTQRKRAELQAAEDRAALTHIARTAVLGQLSASIAHQLNQPLAAILGNAEAALALLQRDELDREQLKSICADIAQEDHRAADIIDRLAALFRRRERDRASLDINELVNETLELASADLVRRGIAITLELSSNLPLVAGERVQLQQVVLNLVVNAADAMATTDDGDRVLLVSTGAAGDEVILEVVDRGTGIAEDALPKLFEPFWTSKQNGMGIGLAICRGIVAAHGGMLSARNNEHGGATFRVVLPGLGERDHGG